MLMISTKLYAQDNPVEFTAEIINPNSDSIVIHNKAFKTTIKGMNGKYTAAFNAPEGLYQFFDGTEFAKLYLRPGFKLNVSIDGKRFYETISFKGIGAVENDFLVKKRINDAMTKKSFGGNLPSQDELEKVLDNRLQQAKTVLKNPEFHPHFNKLMLDEYEVENNRILEELTTVKAKLSSVAQLSGTPSPNFEYDSNTGNKVTLASLKGKYVYIDIWATWCVPCQVEIPYLQKIEEKYREKNIEFVSISIDNIKDVEKWKTFVAQNKLVGRQLHADNDWKSDWIKAFKIDAIPRFILIGPDGKIINADAPRPSSPELYEKLDVLVK